MERNNISLSPSTPLLRWAGSKRQIMSILSEYWNPSYNRYIEPFAGSASLFFHLLPRKALLADINKDLILTYKQIKKNYILVFDALNKFEKSKEQYLELRSINLKTLSLPAKAARFIFLNRYCFNGLYRTNLKGQFNVPYGSGKKSNLPTIQQLKYYSEILKNTTFLSTDFEQTLLKSRKGDFVYMDPPYTVKNRRMFNEYAPNSFNYKKIELLREWLIKLNNLNINFLVSYAVSDEATFLSKGFNKRIVSVKRNIAGFAKDRKIDKEVLIYNI
jgi:DNA adenine methylase